jgi:hypothetical protein
MTKSIYSVVGMQHHHNAEGIVAAMKKGDPMELVRDPENRYDPHAVQVWARGQLIGFIKGSEVKNLAYRMDKQKAERLPARLSFGGERWPMAEVD